MNMENLEVLPQKNAFYLGGMIPLCARYDGFIVDLWGVIHDGKDLFPGVKECLTYLHEQGKSVVFLTNSPRLSYNIGGLLDSFGIEDFLYTSIVSSGDLVYEDLLSFSDDSLENIKPKCFCIDELSDLSLFENVNVEPVGAIDDADFIMVTTITGPLSDADGYQRLLEQGLKRELPLVCANADKSVFVKGHEHIRPGFLGEWYKSRGGTVYMYGKPDGRMFSQALKYFSNIPASKIIVIGDNFDTDIKGALDAGLDSAVVVSQMTGAFYDSETHVLTLDKLASLMKEHSQQFVYCIPGFHL